MIQTDLVPNVTPWCEDTLLNQSVVDLQETPDCRQSSGTKMFHAILNETGEIYRTVETQGLKPLIKTVELLQDAGLVDLIFEQNHTVDGFDTIWSPNKETRYV